MLGSETGADGAWGWRFPSVSTAASRILMCAPSWDTVDLRITEGVPSAEEREPVWSHTGMRLVTPVGSLVEIRWPRSVTLRTKKGTADELCIQPHLNTAVAAMALWRGWQALHAGAFEFNGTAWGVLGAQGSGKSSLLALASHRGLQVVTDDLLVIAGGRALAGPRCIDLRADAAHELGVGTNLGFVGYKELWRLHVRQSPLELNVAGFVIPKWGPLEIQLLPGFLRLRALIERTSVQGIGLNSPQDYLDLASLPMVTWSRPRSWAYSEEALEHLLQRLPQFVS